MKRQQIFILVAIILVISALTGTVSAAIVTMGDIKVSGPGGQSTVHLILDEGPDGLSGYAVNITFDPAVVKVKSVDFPAWAALKSAKGIGESSDLRLMAVDLQKAVQPGAKSIELATITFEGQQTGSSYLHLSRDEFDDDKGSPITRTLTDGSFTVGDVPVVTYEATPVVTPSDKGISATTPAPVLTSQAPTGKVTYSATSPIVPLIGLLMVIGLIGMGGYLQRK